jgi:hypothetical protein
MSSRPFTRIGALAKRLETGEHRRDELGGGLCHWSTAEHRGVGDEAQRMPPGSLVSRGRLCRER